MAKAGEMDNISEERAQSMTEENVQHLMPTGTLSASMARLLTFMTSHDSNARRSISAGLPTVGKCGLMDVSGLEQH